MVFTYAIQVNTTKKLNKRKQRKYILKKSKNKLSTYKAPTSKVYNNPDWDKMMQDIKFRKATGKSPVNLIDFI